MCIPLLDGYVVGTLAAPYDAYRYARGGIHPAGWHAVITPMDFYAVTDHAMFLGVLSAARHGQVFKK